MTEPMLAVDVWLAGYGSPGEIEMRQRQRLTALVAFARKASPLYGELYSGVPERGPDLHELPPVEKTQLMDRFDDWVTDRRVNLASVRQFLESPDRIGCNYLGEYGVWKSSGTSGHVGYFLHDRLALELYDLLLATRGWARWIDPFTVWQLAVHGYRLACIVASGDHFAGIASWRRIAREYAWLGLIMRDFSVMAPLKELVQDLNAWQPAQLVAYPSVLSLLALEQAAGRLRISPVLMLSCGECLDPVEHGLIETAFGAPVHNVYACSESDYVAFGCRHGWMHVNADWVILEPVDADLRPVPAGVPSNTCLITNLANRIQPILRYDLGDSVLVRPESCPCGNSLPAIQVEGRRNQVLRLAAADGNVLSVLPMAITTVLDTVPQLRRFQIIQTGPEAISVRYECERTADREVKRRVNLSLAQFLASQGCANVKVELVRRAPRCDRRSGKLQQVRALG